MVVRLLQRDRAGDPGAAGDRRLHRARQHHPPTLLRPLSQGAQVRQPVGHLALPDLQEQPRRQAKGSCAVSCVNSPHDPFVASKLIGLAESHHNVPSDNIHILLYQATVLFLAGHTGKSR